MLSIIPSLLLALHGLAVVLAAPMEYRLEDIQCRCLSFSTSAKPTLCTYLESHGLDWNTAYSLATDNDLKIQFASQTAMTRVLDIRRPLPSSVLRTLANGVATAAVPLTNATTPPTPLIHTENKIVCRLGDEAQHLDDGQQEDMDLGGAECHYVGVVIAGFMLFLITYLVADYVWTRYSGPRQGSIKLEGDEKALTAEMLHHTVACTAPTDFFS